MLGKLYGKNKRVEKAIECFEVALEIKPGDPEILNDLGFCWFLKKKYEKAIGYFARSLKNSPGYGLAHYNKAMAHYKARQFDKAIFHHDAAVKHNYPGSPKFKSALAPFRTKAQ